MTTAPWHDVTFALLNFVAVVTAVIVWFLHHFTLMVYTPCGGAGTCSLGAQQVISIGFVLVVGSSIVLLL